MKTSYRKTLFLAALISGFHPAQAQIQKDSLADKILLYQLPNGAWPKQLIDKSVVDYRLPINGPLSKKIKDTGVDHATLDNNATTREINSLIKAYKATRHKAYLKAAERGIAYLLSAQYDNGGFPQYYPNKSLYRAKITYNDDAMIKALQVLDNVAKAQNGFEAVEATYRKKAQLAVHKGISCIIKTQIIQNSIPTIWAAQYNEKTLEAAQARKFEPVSLSTSESVAIVRFLMQQNTTPQIQQAIECAITWFRKNAIKGYRFITQKNNSTGQIERKLIPDSTSVIWARFYDIQDNRPLFGDRDDSIKYTFEELSEERKNGYAWFGAWPDKLIREDYLKWKKQHQIQS